MQITKIPLEKLHPAERNVRIHSQKQINEIIRSLGKWKQFRAIVCDENYQILIGNGLFAAMVQAGYEEADCYIITGLSENEKKKLMLSDNRIFSLGVDDLKAFDDIISELAGDFNIPGYDEDLLKTINADFEEADSLMSGYGIISEQSKSEMEKAAVRYAQEDVEFEQRYERIIPSPSNTQQNGAPLQGSNSPYIVTTPEDKNANTAVATPLNETPAMSRRFIICPKCGEKIWL